VKKRRKKKKTKLIIFSFDLLLNQWLPGIGRIRNEEHNKTYLKKRKSGENIER
jgi:hypothetical protein